MILNPNSLPPKTLKKESVSKTLSPYKNAVWLCVPTNSNVLAVRETVTSSAELTLKVFRMAKKTIHIRS